MNIGGLCVFGKNLSEIFLYKYDDVFIKYHYFWLLRRLMSYLSTLAHFLSVHSDDETA